MPTLQYEKPEYEPRRNYTRSTSSASGTELTGINSHAPSASGRSSGSRFARGTTQRRKPSWLASLHPQRRLRDAADLACQSDFPKDRRRLGHGTIAQARRHRRRNAEVGGRLVEPHAAGHVDEHIFADEIEPRALFEHRKQQGQPRLIDSRDHAPRIAKRARAHERLHFHEQRPRSFDRAVHRRPGRVGRPLREEQRRGIRHGHQPLAGHLEHAELAGGAESVLHGAHDPVRMMPLAFEVRGRYRRRARAPSVRQGCRPWSRGRRRRRERSGSSRRTGFASRLHAPGRCCRAPTASSARKSSEWNQR